MEKLIAALFLFGVTSLVAISAVPNKAAAMRAILHWLLGFVVLVVVVLFAQLVVFEWLKWNGTTKNDWFFMVWWIVVLLWFVVGAWRIIRVGSHPEF